MTEQELRKRELEEQQLLSEQRKIEERIKKANMSIERAKEEKRKAKAAERKLKQKQRNHRLIVIGATVEQVLGSELSEEQIPLFKAFLEGQESRGQYLSNALKVSNPASEAPMTYAVEIDSDNCNVEFKG